MLVADRAGFATAIGDLLADDEGRARLGRGARVTSHAFTWGHAQESFATVVRAALEGRRLDAQDPALHRPVDGPVERLISVQCGPSAQLFDP